MNDIDEKTHNALLLLGKKVAEIRKKKKFTQLTLSIETGVAKSYLSDLERGRRNPSIKVLVRLACALNVSVYELFRNQRKRK